MRPASERWTRDGDETHRGHGDVRVGAHGLGERRTTAEVTSVGGDEGQGSLRG